MKKIGNSAFKGCNKLESLVIPSSVSYVGNDAFSQCPNTLFWCVSASRPDSWSESWTGESLGVIWNSSEIFKKSGKTYTFTYTEEKITTESLIIPETYLGYSVTKITGGDKESSNNVIKHLVIPSGVREIGDFAFYNFTALTDVKFNAKSCADVKDVFTNAGINSDGIAVSFGSNVYNVPANLFAGANVKTVDFGSSVRKISDSLFKDCSAITEIAIPNSVLSIDPKAFMNCTALTTFSLGTDVKSIGKQAFTGCSALEKLYINDVAKWCSISFDSAEGSNPLQFAKELYVSGTLTTSITIPKSVTQISPRVFCGVTILETIELHDDITSIGEEAFRDCTGLKSITIPKNLTTINKGTFSGCKNLKEIHIPNSVKKISSHAFYESGITTAYIDAEEIYSSAFEKCTSLTTATIGSSVTYIGKYVFQNCNNLSKLSFSDTKNWYMGNVIFKQDVKDTSTNAKVFSNPKSWSCYNEWNKK